MNQFILALIAGVVCYGYLGRKSETPDTNMYISFYAFIFAYFIAGFFVVKENVGADVTNQPTGTSCNSGDECASGACAKWNNKDACCPSKNWTMCSPNDGCGNWCTELDDGSSCIFDDQCKSGSFCNPGSTGDSVCTKKYNSGTSCDSGNECASDNCGQWNNSHGAPIDKACCPTSHWTACSPLNGCGNWCTKLVNDSPCIFDGQCTSNFCSPGATKNSICKDPPLCGGDDGCKNATSPNCSSCPFTASDGTKTNLCINSTDTGLSLALLPAAAALDCPTDDICTMINCLAKHASDLVDIPDDWFSQFGAESCPNNNCYAYHGGF